MTDDIKDYLITKQILREILVSAGCAEAMKSLLVFLNSNAAQLPLKALHQPGVEADEMMRVLEIDKVTSRRTIERLLEEFLPHLNNSS
ncbi:UNVERIFIED_CONTAM: hypothetical protein Sradi_2162300 [Sesamum radiatum]|uniref:Uncharacterized protein n=1 Tax=Sesamum radiatum TaxID=300843 RepID=A0AAW2T1A4_SESRA